MTYFREVLEAFAAALRQVTALEVAGAQLRQNVAALRDERDKLNTNLDAAQAQIEALQAENVGLITECDQQKAEIEALIADRQELERLLVSAEDDRDELLNQLAELESE